jgi:hypothetical protein
MEGNPTVKFKTERKSCPGQKVAVLGEGSGDIVVAGMTVTIVSAILWDLVRL